jgi:predicted GH43/DUF377 family glycosyl hydrolase
VNPSRRQFLASLAVGSCSLSSLARAGEAKAGWVKSPKNPMLSLGAEGDFDSQNIMSPAIVKEGGRYFLFYAGGPSGPKNKGDYVRYQLGLALSDDGVRWKKTGKPLLPLGEHDNFHTTPALLREPAGDLQKQDGLWHMVYCGNRADDVEHAISKDGLAWAKDPRNPIFKRAYAPSLLAVGKEIWMYYVHKPGGRRPWEVHLARGRDWYSLKPVTSNPMLRLSQPWEKAHLFYPYVLREGKTWVMFYASYWTGHPEKKTATAIGMATSKDGLAWTKSPDNPVLTPTPGSPFDSRYTSAQSVMKDGDRYRMYYGARIDMIHKYYAIGLATKQGKLAE